MSEARGQRINISSGGCNVPFVRDMSVDFVMLVSIVIQCARRAPSAAEVLGLSASPGNSERTSHARLALCLFVHQ